MGVTRLTQPACVVRGCPEPEGPSLRIPLQQRMVRLRVSASSAHAHFCKTRGAAEGDGEKWPWII